MTGSTKDTETRKDRHTGFTTRPSHLRKLKNGEDEAWREFYCKYRSMITAISKKTPSAGKGQRY